MEAGKVNGKTRVYKQGSIVVSSTGKIRTGSVVIDDVKYVIENYVVVKAYDRYDSTETDLENMYTAPKVEYDGVEQTYTQEKGKWVLVK